MVQVVASGQHTTLDAPTTLDVLTAVEAPTTLDVLTVVEAPTTVEEISKPKHGAIDKLLKRLSVDKLLKRWSALNHNSRRLLLAIPLVSTLVLLGVVLGFVIRGRSSHIVVVPANATPSSIRPQAVSEARVQSSPQPAPDTLTVDMLPLVAPSGQRGSSEPGKNNSELGPRKSDPGASRSAPRTTKSVRDYGI